MSPGKVTLAVRPEHASLSGATGSVLPGTLTNIVYFGTDTHFHVELDGGGRFVLRQQNQPDQTQTREVGDRVEVTLAPGVGQVLRD
jgi:spermidine/putrescine transport system ATP-binding protein